jgi:hypothetical protein
MKDMYILCESFSNINNLNDNLTNRVQLGYEVVAIRQYQLYNWSMNA